MNPLINILIRDNLHLGVAVKGAGSGSQQNLSVRRPHGSSGALHVCKSAEGQSERSTSPSPSSAAACKHHTFRVCTWIIEQPDRKLTNDGDPLKLPHNIFIWGDFTLLSFSTSQALSVCVRTVYPLLCLPKPQGPGRPNTRLLKNITEQAAGEIEDSHKKRKEKRGRENERERESNRGRVSRASQELLRSVCRFAPAF